MAINGYPNNANNSSYCDFFVGSLWPGYIAAIWHHSWWF